MRLRADGRVGFALRIVAVLALAAGALGCAATPAGTPVSLPRGRLGIGFDDLRYSKKLHRLLAPAGRTGRLDLIDPDTLAITSIAGLSSTAGYSGGHDDGPTSVDEALGKLYVTDRTSRKLVVIDPAARRVVARVPLAAGPDYVRFVAATREIWVTEPDASQIEIFTVDQEGTPAHAAIIPVADGPESMVVDGARGRVYTHRWHATTLAIDVRTRGVVAEWKNRCENSRGIALDEPRGILFAGCKEGRATALDVAHDGRVISTIVEGSGFDVIDYNDVLGHLYFAGGACACLVIFAVSPRGELSLSRRFDAPSSTHCAVADDRGHAWVCDPKSGRLLRVDDDAPRPNRAVAASPPGNAARGARAVLAGQPRR